MSIYKSIDELVGKTPIAELASLQKALDLKARIFAKLEFFNPAGSAKDRIAKDMLNDAEKKGLLNKSTVIIEPTSGNTGIGLAAIAASRGYRTLIVMPESMSEERRRLMKAYGAELVLTQAELGMKGSIDKAYELKAEIPNSFIPSQFENPANPRAHFETTGPEIWADMQGEIDIFVAGVGTGGTISGAGKYLKLQKNDVSVVAVEPKDSPVLSGGAAGAHGLQGIGAGFIPAALDTEVYDKIITVSTEEAFSAARLLAKSEGYLSGISSGAALHAAIELAKLDENRGKKIVVLLPDTGERYLSGELYQ